MKQKVLVIFLMGILSAGLSGADKAGYALLDKLIGTFQKLAAEGTGGKEALEGPLRQMMADAKKAKAEGKVDGVFFNRYRRLLMVIQLAILEDPEGILAPVIEREVGDFIRDMKGEEGSIKGSQGIGNIAFALADELINLHLYLENEQRKAELLEKFQQRFEAGVTEKKKENTSPPLH